MKIKLDFDAKGKDLNRKCRSDGGMVVYHYPGMKFLTARKYVYPKITEANHEFGSTTKHLAELYKNLSVGMKLDLVKVKSKIRVSKKCNLYVVFIKIIHNFAKVNSSIDILSLTDRDIVENWSKIICL